MDQPRPRPLEIGLTLLPFEDRCEQAHRWSTLMAVAQTAEAVGFDAIWIPDHLIFQEEGQEVSGAWEAWSILTGLAVATTRVALGSFVLCTAWRNPALIAKMADTVDEMSGGRLILGLGAGWSPPDFDAFGFPFDHLYSRFEEALGIIHPLLRTGQVDFAGTYYQARECELHPRGPRPGGPPIMIGATRAKMLRLTARYADLWNVDWRNQPQEVATFNAAVDAACAEVGRDPATLIRTAGIMVNLPDHPAHPGLDPTSPPLAGSPDDIAETLREHARGGVAHAQILLNTTSVAGIEAFAPVLEALDRYPQASPRPA
jgi:alkanesulfonate monooxygenase SsuD/methylene tetrahydromethanopterin reductase-like flavin-dependent oxidoreductase (luciferase family)